MSQGATLCERLDWDSRFFGVSIARAVPSRVDLLTRDAILDWCRAEGVDCLYFLADEDADTMRLLEDAAFSRVDDRVTLELQAIPPTSSPRADTRAACQSDIAALRNIAAVSHNDTRSLGLIGVDRSYRRQGIGAHLMDGALAWISGKSVRRVRTATQGRNVASHGFFQKAGFRPTGRAIWYHRWFSPSIGAAS